MTDDNLLERLVAAERDHPNPPAVARARVWSRLEASIPSASGAAGAVTPGGPGGLAALASSAAAIGVLTGVALMLAPVAQPSPWRATIAANLPPAASAPLEAVSPAVADPPIAGTTTPASSPTPASPPTPAPPPAVVAAPFAVPSPAAVPKPSRLERLEPTDGSVKGADVASGAKTSAPAPVAPLAGRAKARRDAPDPDAERKLIEAARRSLVSGQARVALRRVREHRRKFRRGTLSQEREALWVRALVALGRTDQAKKRGAGFLKRFPRSLHRRAVQAALKRLD